MGVYAYRDDLGDLDYFTGTYDEFMDFLNEHPEYSR